MGLLDGKVAIVTGAGHGVGRGHAVQLAEAGAKVVVNDLGGSTRGEGADEKVAQATVDVIRGRGGEAVADANDVSSFDDAGAMVQKAIDTFGGLDILVNNAGVIEPISEIATSDPAIWARNIQINLIGAYNVVRAVLEGMMTSAGGSIINVSSGAAYRPLEGWSAYCAGKAALAMMTRSIALETKGRGIRIFGFSPGTIDTDMQVKIRASGINQISKVPRANLSPVEHAVRGLLYLCDSASDDLIGEDASMRDEAFRKRIGLG
jgi:3-oxoacyl-[acyl-carrier protein] reductase